MQIIRSATFEGMCDSNGYPTDKYKELYETLSKNGVKTIITGFMYISDQGRAMQSGQAGMDNIDKIPAFKEITDVVHKNGSRIIAQIAHVGRQTTNTGFEIVGVSDKKSKYFNEKPKVLTTEQIYEIIEQFANSAHYAQKAGFDGVQVHAAHGYLIHQFLLSSVNNRTDVFKDGTLFLQKIIEKIREKCGDFPIWLKVSGGLDIENYTKKQFADLIRKIDKLRVSAIEVSYGTMDNALNIFRGDVPVKAILKHNPIYNKKIFLWKIFVLPFLKIKIKKYTPMYNLEYAKIAKANTNILIFVVGGFRTGNEIFNCGLDGVSLCRPFICEPDFMLKLQQNNDYKSKCINCNLCAIMTDTKYSLNCFGGKNGSKNN